MYVRSGRTWAYDTIAIGTGGGAHTAGDVVSTTDGEMLEFATGLAAGESGLILKSICYIDSTALFSGGAGYTLQLFKRPVTIQDTNSAFSIVTTDADAYLGPLTISTLALKVDGSTGIAVASDLGQNFDFTLSSTDRNIYGKLVANGGETTVNSKTITVGLGVIPL